MVPTRRAIGVAALCAVLGVAAGYLAATWRLTPPPTRVVTVEVPAVPPAPAGPVLAARPEGQSPRPAPTLPAPVASVEEVDAGLARIAGTSIEVDVAESDGRPFEGATVYAVPAGAAPANSRIDGCPWPSAQTDVAGRARIPLPADGRYDVGAVGPLRFAMREAVTVAGGMAVPVEIRFPEMAAIRIDAAHDLICPEHVVTIRGEQEGATYPIRGEFPRLVAWEKRVPAGGTIIEAPRGVSFTTSAHCPRASTRCRAALRADPAVVRSPGTVTIRAGPGETPPGPDSVRVHVLARVEWVSTPPVTGRLLVFFGAAPDGATPQETEALLEWGSTDQPDWSHFAFDFQPNVPVGRKVKFSWRGDGVIQDSTVAGDFSRGGSPELRFTIRCRGDSIPGILEAIDIVDADGLPVPWPEGTENPWDLVTADGESMGRYVAREGSGQRLADYFRFAGKRATVVHGAWRTSVPVDLPTVGRAKVTVALGGYVLVHVRTQPPKDAGPLLLAREDGGWLGTRPAQEIPPPSEVGEPWTDTCGAVYSGTLVGPLPAGDVPLRVTLGGVEVGRVVARVKAGEVTVLSLR